MANRQERSGGSVPKPKPPTTSYGDERRTPSSTPVVPAAFRPTPTQPPRVTPTPAPRNYAGSSPTGPNASMLYKAPTPSIRDLTGPASYTPYRAPEIRRYQPTPTGPLSRAMSSQFKATQPTAREQAAAILGTTLGPAEPPKPKKSYLQKFPHIAQEIQIARATMDDFQFDSFMATQLENYKGWQGEQFDAALDRKRQRLRAYNDAAHLAEESGDLDYREDNPMNPNLTKFPSLKGPGTPEFLLKQMQTRLAAVPAGSPQAEAIRKLYMGDPPYTKGLLDYAAVGNPYSKYSHLVEHKQGLKDAEFYAQEALDKSTARILANNEKWKDRPEYQILDPHEPGLNLLSSNPLDNPLLKKGRSKAETRRLLEYTTQALKDGTFWEQANTLYSGLQNMPFFGKPPPSREEMEKAAAEESLGRTERGKALDDAKLAAKEREGINVIGGGGTTPSAAEQLSGPDAWDPVAAGNRTEGTAALVQFAINPALGTFEATMDKFQRPLTSLVEGAMYIHRQDEEPEDTHATGIYGEIFGKNMSDSYDDLNVGDVGGVAKAMWHGLWQENIWSNADEHQNDYMDLIRQNAELDPHVNIYDSEIYQTVVGLGADLVLDPLNIGGLNIVNKVSKASKLTGIMDIGKAASAEDQAAFDLSRGPLMEHTIQFAKDAEIIDHADAKDALDIISGRVPLPKSGKGVREHVARVETAVDRLHELAGEKFRERRAAGNEAHQAVKDKAEEMRVRREEVLAAHGMSVVRQSLERFVGEQVRAGILDKSALQRYSSDGMLHSLDIEKVTDDINRQMSYHNALAAQMHEIYQEQFLKAPSSAGYHPKLLSGGQEEKIRGLQVEENQYLNELFDKRDKLEREFAMRSIPKEGFNATPGELTADELTELGGASARQEVITPAEQRQLTELNEQIERQHKKVMEKYGRVEKGSATRLHKETGYLRGLEDQEPYQKHLRIMGQAEALLAKGINGKSPWTDPKIDVRKLLGRDIWNTPGLKDQDIYDAWSMARGKTWGDETMKPYVDAIDNLKERVKSQRTHYNSVKKNKNSRPRDKQDSKKNLERAERALRAQQRVMNQAQAARFVHILGETLERSGKGTLRETNRGNKLWRALQDVRTKLNDANNAVNLDAPGARIVNDTTEGRVAPGKHTEKDADLGTPTAKGIKWDPEKMKPEDRPQTKPSTGMPAKSKEGTGPAAKAFERRGLDTEAAPEHNLDRSDWPTEFLDEEGNLLPDAFTPPEGVSTYNDAQWLEHMETQIMRAMDEDQRDYWLKAMDSIDLNNPPEGFYKDGKIQPAFRRYIHWDPYNGTWTREGTTNNPEYDEWLDQVTGVLTREYLKTRRGIDRAKKMDLINPIEDQAKIDWDERLRESANKVAPMFAHADGTRLTAADKLDDSMQLFPYITDPSDPTKIIMFGKPGQSGKQLENIPGERGVRKQEKIPSSDERLIEYATPAEERESQNLLDVIGEIERGVQTKTNVKNISDKANLGINEGSTGLVKGQKPAPPSKAKKAVIGQSRFTSKSAKKLVAKRVLSDERLMERMGYIISNLRDEGWHWSGDIEEDILHLLKHKETAKYDLSLPKMVGRRLFQEQNGMTFGEAVSLRDKALGHTIDSISGTWTSLNGTQMTMREFVNKALRSQEDFAEVMGEGPVKFHKTANAKSEKEARTITERGVRVVQSIRTQRGNRLSQQWAKDNWEYLQQLSHTERVRRLEQGFKATRNQKAYQAAAQRKAYIQMRKDRAREAGLYSPGNKKENAKLEKAAGRETSTEAYDRTIGWLEDALYAKQLSNKGFSNQLQLPRKMNIGATDKELLDYAAQNMKAEKYAEIKAAKAQADNASRQERIDLGHQIAELERQIDSINDNFIEFENQAMAAKTLYDKELKTEAILRAARIPIAKQDRQIAVRLLGTHHAIPGSEHFFRGVEKSAELPVGKQIAATWQKFFQAPSRIIDDDFTMARARQLGLTPAIIKRGVMKLAHYWDKIDPIVRKKEWEKVRNRGKLKAIRGKETHDALKGNFEQYLPYFQRNKIPTGMGPDSFVTMHDMNRFLREHYKIDTKLGAARMKTADDLIYAITHYTDDTGKVVKKSDKSLDDPFEILWNLEVASSLVMADKGFKKTMTSFGIYRGLMKAGDVLKQAPDFQEDIHGVVAKLEGQGWRTVPGLDDGTHFYHPDVADGIEQMLKMFGPPDSKGDGMAHLALKLFDDATAIWKGANTIPNPGWWTRNVIGEMMASWLDGVWSALSYKHGAAVVKFGRSDDIDQLAAANSQFPMEEWEKAGGEKAIKGSDVLYRMANGEKVSAERLHWAGQEHGISTGYFNTEYARREGAGGKLRSNKATGAVIGGWNNTVQGAENVENWLRMSHFADVIRRAPKSMSFDEAAKDAAWRVKKFHVDYTDFTEFEKTVMARVFPFYKYTRKTAPLMLSQMFVNPGKMMVVPKTMNALSNQLSSQDFHEDKNGYMPNFTGIAPSWLASLFAFQTTTENSDGMFTAFRFPTPLIDSAMAGLNPLGTTGTLLNPFIKAPIEQAMSHTIPGGIGESNMSIDLNDPKYEGATFDESDERLKALMRNSGSWGNFFSKGVGRNAGNYENNKSWQDYASLSGIGVYDPFMETPEGLTSLPPGSKMPAPVGPGAIDFIGQGRRPRRR